MAQGKLKVKTKLPSKAKGKKAGKKGPAAAKRSKRPAAPKKKKETEGAKIKKMITKNLNQTVETEIRKVALEGKKTLSSAQKAVAAHNTKKGGGKKK